MTTGERIRQRREELGMTQDELAAIVGYKHKTSISQIEQDKVGIKQGKILAIAEALRIPAVDLIVLDEETELKAFSYNSFLNESPAMRGLNEIIKSRATDYSFVEKVYEYARALSLLYPKRADEEEDD